MLSGWNNRSFRQAAAAIVLALATGAIGAQDPRPPVYPPPGSYPEPTKPGDYAAGTPTPQGGVVPGPKSIRRGARPPGLAGAAENPAQKSKLEEMLEKALKNNPDLHVAAAKVQEAEAELNRTRLEVTRKVVRMYATLDAARKNAAGAAERMEEVRKLVERQAISKEDARESEKVLTEAKAQLAAAEAELPYLLGEQPANAGATWVINTFKDIHDIHVQPQLPAKKVSSNADGSGTLIQGADGVLYFLSLEDLKTGKPSGAAPKLPQGTVADHLREALDTPVTVDYKDMPLTKVLKDLEKSYRVTFIVRWDVSQADEPKVNLHVDDQPLGAVFEAISDQTGAGFFVREYGILVMSQSSSPPNALLLKDFWKAHHSSTQPGDKSKSAGDSKSK